MSRLFSSQKKILNCSISHCCILNQNMVWKKGNHQTEPITYWLLPPPLAPKYLRCFCDSTLKFFPNSKKVTFSKGEVWEWSWSSFTVPMCPRTQLSSAMPRLFHNPPPPLNNSPVIFWICDAWLKELVTSHSIGWSRVAKPSCTSAVILVDTLPLPGRLQTHGSFPSR